MLDRPEIVRDAINDARGADREAERPVVDVHAPQRIHVRPFLPAVAVVGERLGRAVGVADAQRASARVAEKRRRARAGGAGKRH